jgi:hypothetical protein
VSPACLWFPTSCFSSNLTLIAWTKKDLLVKTVKQQTARFGPNTLADTCRPSSCFSLDDHATTAVASRLCCKTNTNHIETEGSILFASLSANSTWRIVTSKDRKTVTLPASHRLSHSHSRRRHNHRYKYHSQIRSRRREIRSCPPTEVEETVLVDLEAGIHMVCMRVWCDLEHVVARNGLW